PLQSRNSHNWETNSLVRIATDAPKQNQPPRYEMVLGFGVLGFDKVVTGLQQTIAGDLTSWQDKIAAALGALSGYEVGRWVATVAAVQPPCDSPEFLSMLSTLEQKGEGITVGKAI